ncbi:F0F1 ATP synthase subunit epsilon [Paraburkholderia sp. BL21I4N1]|uniref:F0F1 ATP synthase subunit epsilon n=1 Tax=Paraburkholderia sp. BL21I4N1 TaxID=1938801 RepID=UPI000CFD8DBE|nr:F0F1 ATP synthase subunit epsilon [Paraburkholderia sp. BL21I4N1]PQV50713.1 ATP synthase F1 subcomplex epsilon subunit [Paraburkholderia sp. BL21I4N1]
MQVDILSVEHMLYSGDASFIVLPGLIGELGILPGHAPLLTQIKPGVVTIHEQGKNAQQRIFVAGGILEVLPDSVIVLADHAVRTPELDSTKANDARREAQALRARYADARRPGFDFAAAKAELADELARFFMLALRHGAQE